MKLARAFVHAYRGITYTFWEERNFRIHVLLAALVLLLGFWFQISAFEWAWIGIAIALVLGFELVNTAIENILDLVSPGYHPLVRRAKDAAAGAVLVAALFALAVGTIIYGPRLWTAFFVN